MFGTEGALMTESDTPFRAAQRAKLARLKAKQEDAPAPKKVTKKKAKKKTG